MAENKGKNRGWDNLKPCKPGETANPYGRSKGQRNFKTIYREALKKIAKLNELTPEDLEDDIIAKGVSAARRGDYRFYKDLLDRLDGTPIQRNDVTTGGEKIYVITRGEDKSVEPTQKSRENNNE